MPAELRRERSRSHSTERLREPGEHHEVSVELDSFKPSNAERREPIFLFEPAELALASGASPVEVAPPLRLARDQRVQPVGLDPDGRGLAASGQAAPLRRVPLEVRSCERPGSCSHFGAA